MSIKQWAKALVGKKEAPTGPLSRANADKWDKDRGKAEAKSEHANKTDTAAAHLEAVSAHRTAGESARSFGASLSARAHEKKASEHEARADEIKRDEKGRFASK